MARFVWALLATLALIARPAAAEEESLSEEIGDVLQILLPVSAAAVSSIKRDWEGLKQ